MYRNNIQVTTTLSYLSSRAKRSGAEGSAVCFGSRIFFLAERNTSPPIGVLSSQEAREDPYEEAIDHGNPSAPNCACGMLSSPVLSTAAPSAACRRASGTTGLSRWRGSRPARHRPWSTARRVPSPALSQSAGAASPHRGLPPRFPRWLRPGVSSRTAATSRLLRSASERNGIRHRRGWIFWFSHPRSMSQRTAQPGGKTKRVVSDPPSVTG